MQSFKRLAHHLRGVGAEFSEFEEKIVETSSRLSVPNTQGKKYDYIATIHKLEHFAKPEKILSVWWKSINPGGVLLLVLPDDRFYPHVGSAECNREHKLDFNYDVVETMMGMVAPDAELIEKSFDDGACSFWMVYRKPGQLNVQNSIVQKTLRYFKKIPKYDIVIPVYGKHDLLRQCLNSITNAGWEPDKIIIVHDKDNEKLEVPAYEGFKVIVTHAKERLGFAGAVNKGVKECRNKSVILLNTDVTVKPEGDKKLLAALRRSSVGIVGQSGGRLDESFAYAGEGLDYIEMYCCAFRKSVFDDLGGLDEQFFPGYGEDSDFGIRLRKAGYSIVTADDVCKHIGNQSFGKSAELNKIINDHRITLQKKHQRGRVVFVCASTGMSGGIKVVWNCAQALREQGWITVACFIGKDYRLQDKPKEWDAFEIWTENNIQKCKEPFDVVISTFHRTIPFAATLKAKHHIGLIQSDEPEWYRPDATDFKIVKEQFMTKGFKHIIIADYMYSFAEKYKMNILGKIENGVDDLTFYPTWNLWREWEKQKPTIITMRKGGHCWFDNQQKLDDAIKLIDPEKYPGLKYLSIGTIGTRGKEFNCEYQEVRTTNASDVCRYLNHATIYVHPSAIEGDSLAVKEAMSCGIPVICTPIASDATHDGYNCLMLKDVTPKHIAAKIKYLLDNPDIRETLSRNGIATARKLTLENQRKQFVEIINKEVGIK